MKAKEIVEWLKGKLGDDYSPRYNKFWEEHDYAFGDTECGFESAYTLNYDHLEEEMDKWIQETFGEDD